MGVKNYWKNLKDYGQQTTRLVFQYKWCCLANCQNTSNFFIEEEQIASHDGVNWLTDLGDVVVVRQQKEHVLITTV